MWFLVCLLFFTKDCFSAEFPFVFQSYDCPKALSEAVNSAIVSSVDAGRKPILVSDIDETLIKRIPFAIPERFMQTVLYKHLIDSSAILSIYGLLALTARPMDYPGNVLITNITLHGCVPLFYQGMHSLSNFEGAILNTVVDPQSRFLCDSGLLLMGNGGLTKRQVIDEYFKLNPLKQEHEYDLIFIDNLRHWFPEFCTGGYDPRIRMGHFFHYNDVVGEGVLTASTPLASLPTVAPSFTTVLVQQDSDDEDVESYQMIRLPHPPTAHDHNATDKDEELFELAEFLCTLHSGEFKLSSPSAAVLPRDRAGGQSPPRAHIPSLSRDDPG